MTDIIDCEKRRFEFFSNRAIRRLDNSEQRLSRGKRALIIIGLGIAAWIPVLAVIGFLSGAL